MMVVGDDGCLALVGDQEEDDGGDVDACVLKILYVLYVYY